MFPPITARLLPPEIATELDRATGAALEGMDAAPDRQAEQARIDFWQQLEEGKPVEGETLLELRMSVMRSALGSPSAASEREAARYVINDLSLFAVGLSQILRRGEGSTGEWAAVLGHLYGASSAASESLRLVTAGGKLLTQLHGHFAEERKQVQTRLGAMAGSDVAQKLFLDSLDGVSPWGELSFRKALNSLAEHFEALDQGKPSELGPEAVPVLGDYSNKEAATLFRDIASKLDRYEEWTQQLLQFSGHLEEGSASRWLETLVGAIHGAEGSYPTFGWLGPKVD